MAIPASQIVQVNPRLISAGGTDLVMNGLLLTDNAVIPTSKMVLSFASADDVANYFGATSNEYTAATKYFLGYNNSFTKPRAFLIGRRVSTAAAAWVRGGEVATTLDDLKLITDGSFGIKINGSTSSTISSIDLSSATSMSEVASLIQTAISAVVSSTTVSYSSTFGAFTITSPTTGSASTIDFASQVSSGTDLSAPLCLTEATGAVLSQGSDVMTVANNMTAIRTANDNWVCFTTATEQTTSDALVYAQWANSMGVDYLYVAYSATTSTITAMNTAFVSADVSATTLVYGGLADAVFILATAASIDWNRYNGVITFAFKKQSGLGAQVTNGTVAQSLLSGNANFVGDYATRNDDFVFLYNGSMYGDYKFIDPYINAVWLKNCIQVAVMNGLTSVGRVPYNDAGYALIRAWIMDPVKRALNNGVIDRGVTLSEAQKAQLVQEIGEDVSDDIFANGYYLYIADPGASIRVTRESPTISLYYSYGGSVQSVTISSTVLL